MEGKMAAFSHIPSILTAQEYNPSLKKIKLDIAVYHTFKAMR